jgi:hypothetical protein
LGAFQLVSAGPRLGYNVPIADRWSVWPEVYGAYQVDWGEFAPSSGFAVGAYVPVLYHPAPHLFFGLGPGVSTSWLVAGAGTHGNSVTTYGFSLSVGGWLGR